jgi:hypothetical protein
VVALAVVALHFITIDHVWHRPFETIFPSQPFRLRLAGCLLVLPDQLLRHLHEQMEARRRGVGAFHITRIRDGQMNGSTCKNSGRIACS